MIVMESVDVFSDVVGYRTIHTSSIGTNVYGLGLGGLLQSEISKHLSLTLWSAVVVRGCVSHWYSR